MGVCIVPFFGKKSLEINFKMKFFEISLWGNTSYENKAYTHTPTNADIFHRAASRGINIYKINQQLKGT